MTHFLNKIKKCKVSLRIGMKNYIMLDFLGKVEKSLLFLFELNFQVVFFKKSTLFISFNFSIFVLIPKF